MLGSDLNSLFRQTYFNVTEIDSNKFHNIENFIFKTDKAEQKWISLSTELLSEWRYRLRSTYVRWCLAINGLFVACERYSSPEWGDPDKKFYVKSLRFDRMKVLTESPIAIWDGTFTAESSINTAPMLCAWALMDIYRCMEEFIFGLYRVYLNGHPHDLMKGREFAHLRRLYRKSQESKELCDEWEVAWEKRVNSWQRKSLYKGLGSVFLAYWLQARLNAPSVTKLAPENWASSVAETIAGVGILRNSLMHGCKAVPSELAEFATKSNSMNFDFKKGDPLRIELYHLMGVEFFCDQLLTSINISLCELTHLRKRSHRVSDEALHQTASSCVIQSSAK